MDSKLSLRINKKNPNHHIWNNRGVYWIALTVHEDAVCTRVRKSLKTNDIFEARQRRDILLKKMKKNIKVAA